MSVYCNRFIEKIYYAFPAVIFLFLFIFSFHIYAGQPGAGTRVITIAIDPGHGGEIDFGAKGPGGKLEKDMTLKLAGMIASDLGARFNIILTRTEDTDLGIQERTAVANHFKADLFISIHAGGSFVNKTRGMSISYFTDTHQNTAENGVFQEPGKHPPALPPAAEGEERLKTAATSYGRIRPGRTAEDPQRLTGSGEIKRTAYDPGPHLHWEKIQTKYEKPSSDLANIVKKNLSGIITNSEIRIGAANYAVLEGADMPAILIEAGCLTNPAEEEALSGKEYPAAIVKGLGLAVDEYFQNIGLQEKIKRAN